VVALIFNDKGEVLLTVRGVEPNIGSLDLPGGFVDPGETAEEALRREIFEELNLEITDASYLISFANEYLFSGLNVYTTDITFVCKVKSFENIRVADDVIDYRFVPLDDIDFSQIFSQSITGILQHCQSLKGKFD
jgi:mutator protein MutT